MACTIQEPSLFLDSPPGHTPPASLPLSMPRVAVKRRWTQLPALWCTESLLSSCCGNNICSPYYGLQDLSLPYLIMPPPTSSPTTTLFPCTPDTLAFLSIPAPAPGTLHLPFLLSRKRLSKFSHAWASFPHQSGLKCHLFAEVCLTTINPQSLAIPSPCFSSLLVLTHS